MCLLSFSLKIFLSSVSWHLSGFIGQLSKADNISIVSLTEALWHIKSLLEEWIWKLSSFVFIVPYSRSRPGSPAVTVAIKDSVYRLLPGTDVICFNETHLTTNKLLSLTPHHPWYCLTAPQFFQMILSGFDALWGYQCGFACVGPSTELWIYSSQPFSVFCLKFIDWLPTIYTAIVSNSCWYLQSYFQW